MDYNIPSGGYSRDKKIVFLEFRLSCYRYKKMIIISFVSLVKIYHWPKFERHSSIKRTATPLRNWKLKWSWQAHFLSHSFQIFRKVLFFEDLQMILLSVLEIFIGTKVAKNMPKLYIQMWRGSWGIVFTDLSLTTLNTCHRLS